MTNFLSKGKERTKENSLSETNNNNNNNNLMFEVVDEEIFPKISLLSQ